MKLFYLDRETDVSGISGVGRVCEGVVFDDGICIIHWIIGEVHSSTIFNNLEEWMRN